MRIKISPTQSRPAALALARLLRITPRDALWLLSEPRILPAELDDAAVEALRTEDEYEGLQQEALQGQLQLPGEARRRRGGWR